MNQRSSACDVGSRVFWACMALSLAASVVVGNPVASSSRGGPALLTHHLTKRSFQAIECKGVYDKSIFARLDRICEDCYSLFREPSVHSLCRRDCFTSQHFKGCLDTLQLTDEIEQVQTWIKQLHGADPVL